MHFDPPNFETWAWLCSKSASIGEATNACFSYVFFRTREQWRKQKQRRHSEAPRGESFCGGKNKASDGSADDLLRHHRTKKGHNKTKHWKESCRGPVTLETGARISYIETVGNTCKGTSLGKKTAGHRGSRRLKVIVAVGKVGNKQRHHLQFYAEDEELLTGQKQWETFFEHTVYISALLWSWLLV